MNPDNDPLKTLVPLWLLVILWSIALALVVLLWKKLPTPWNIIMSVPYCVALFPFPCPFWLIWYDGKPKSVKGKVKAIAGIWLLISVACLVYFLKHPH